MKHIHFCPVCHKYTMLEQCLRCGAASPLAKPPKFSLQDKYAALRRESRKEALRKKGRY